MGKVAGTYCGSLVPVPSQCSLQTQMGGPKTPSWWAPGAVSWLWIPFPLWAGSWRASCLERGKSCPEMAHEDPRGILLHLVSVGCAPQRAGSAAGLPATPTGPMGTPGLRGAPWPQPFPSFLHGQEALSPGSCSCCRSFPHPPRALSPTSHPCHVQLLLGRIPAPLVVLVSLSPCLGAGTGLGVPIELLGPRGHRATGIP